MEFNSNKSIYLQICDAICEQILSGVLKPDERIPSVREYGAEIGVNPNTIMRSYEKLTADGIIYNKRGLGYFVAKGAARRIAKERKHTFLTEELPELFRKMNTLKITFDELRELYENKKQ